MAESENGKGGKPEFARAIKLNWDAIAAIIAALIGFLAILTSAYTALSIRQQTRAQVWPHLEITVGGSRQALLVLNEGVGPAIVHTVEVQVDGKPQPDWAHVMAALGMPNADFNQSTLSNGVLASNDTLLFLSFPDKIDFRSFISAAQQHLIVRTCYCSTLSDCWLVVGPWLNKPNHHSIEPLRECPSVPEADEFND